MRHIMTFRLPTRLFLPFRSKPLTGQDVGWFHPTAAVLIGLFAPALSAFFIIQLGGPVIHGPPKDGSGYSLADHFAILTGALTMSFLVSWIAAPFALLVLRAAAMLGYAGWATAVFAAPVMGLPIVHFVLNGDLTSDTYAILPHMIISVGILGLSVWAAFWILFALRPKFRSAQAG